MIRLGDTASVRWPVRPAVVCAILVVAALGAGVVALSLGEFTVSALDVVRTIVRRTDQRLETAVVQWRMPRIVIGLLFGAMLGLGGAVFQSLTRNPLGSPDVIGFDAGAYSGAVVTIIAVHSTALVVPGAIIGGVATALAVYLLAYRRGVHGFRLIVVGIAITSMLGALNTYLILRADIWTAQMAALWGAGSVNDVDWSDVRRALVAGGLALLPVLWCGRRLGLLELGDDAARAVGVHVERTRLALIVGGSALTAVVTAIAGPITFLALAAPQLARRLTRSAGLPLAASAAMGSLLFVVCDLIAHRAVPAILPVGLITIVLGGGYLVWLLILRSREEIR